MRRSSACAERRSRRRRARCRLRRRGRAGRPAAEAEAVRRDRAARAAGRPSSPATPRSSRSPRSWRGLRDRTRALGTHWWNPPFLVPLVEVIGTRWTSPEAIDFTMKLHAAAGKMPAHVKKDVPGFVGNRLQHALWREAIALVEHGICDAETVDTVIKASVRPPARRAGPAGKCRYGRHRSDARDPQDRAARHRQRPGPSPYLENWSARQARLQVRRRLPQVER